MDALYEVEELPGVEVPGGHYALITARDGLRWATASSGRAVGRILQAHGAPRL